MNIGVVHFGSYTTGVTEIITRLIEANIESYRLYGIDWNRHTKGIEVKELHRESIAQAQFNGDAILSAFPEQYWNEGSKSLIHENIKLDYLILLGGSKETVSTSSIKTLHVPVSIFNSEDHSSYSLGYDSALNTIYSSIEKIRDTASSLIYNKLRVFPIQIPGNKYTPLVQDTALAINAPFVRQDDDEAITIIKEAIQEKNSRNESYLFIIMDHSVNHQSLEQKIAVEFDVDWKVMSISESQCVGPFPTAIDRIVIGRISDKIIELINTSSLDSGYIGIQDLQVTYYKN
ncbi:6-phosphofructokinase [Litchfieldia salsa]|uniref:6-phosphofructokinase n=1 Tax=Litchfieldia salsa TaxID=930152 RepID=A0A1H0X1Z2_9BACI|nr:6-phosphofructokinase [Litchfieldia salsa]SDP96977.1 6-phosphofructokinase [Litchfieldia salsa]